MKEIERGVELVVDERELGLVAFWVVFHFGLEGWEREFLGGEAGGGERGGGDVRGGAARCRRHG